MEAPFVSVIVPAFNCEATLGEAIESALRGTFQDFEIILVNDGSTDGTAELAESFAGTDPRIRVYHQRQAGVSAACNLALQHARGTFAGRLDSDDLWHPDKLRRQVEIAAEQPDAAFIFAGVRYIDAEGRVVHDAPLQSFPRSTLCRGIYESLIGGNSSAVFRTKAAMELGGYDESLSSWEDLLLQLKISARHPIAGVPEYLVGYRLRPGSLSSSANNIERSWRRARELIRLLFPEVPTIVDSWAHGRRCALLAESFAWEGNMLKSARLLLEAARYDPEWTTCFLRYRIGRRLGLNTAERREADGPRPLFRECQAHETVGLSSYERGLRGQALERLEAHRIAKLSAMDEALANSKKPQPSGLPPASASRTNPLEQAHP